MDSVSSQLLLSGSAEAPPGQVLFTSSNSWVVPEGVTSVSVLLVGRGGIGATSASSPSTVAANSTLARGATTLLFAQAGGHGGSSVQAVGSTLGGSIGGGDGGLGHAGSLFSGGGGGGAGGYSGNGGNGGTSPTAGAGGAGGGGMGATSAYQGGGGGVGVGLLGEGASGAAGVSPRGGGGGGSSGVSGTAGSSGGAAGGGGSYGGGRGGSETAVRAGGGGALRYYNNLLVTPGETLTITLPSPNTDAGPPACRIIWPGNERQFPSTRTADE